MRFICKWLPIIFGCHCRADRSFYFNRTKLPICARCTGELIGIIISCFTFKFYNFNIITKIFFMIPMLIDGFIQLKTKYESNNMKRLITGILFGYALCNFFIKSIIFTLTLGHNCAKYIRK